MLPLNVASPFFPTPHSTSEFIGVLDLRAGNLLNSHLVLSGPFLQSFEVSLVYQLTSCPSSSEVFHKFVILFLGPQGSAFTQRALTHMRGTVKAEHQNKRSCK